MDDRARFLRPSGAAIWSKCYGYAKLCAAILAELPDYYEEETDIDVREDGTACHWLAHEVWNRRNHETGTLSPNHRLITDEMHDAVSDYHALLCSWPNVVAVLEEKMPVSHAVWGCQDGTPDAFAFDPDTYTLYIADLKFGFRFVEVWFNLQMTLYAFGIIYQLDLDIYRLTIVFHIFQPRSQHPEGQLRVWRTTGKQLIGLIDELRLAAAASMGENPPCTVNPGCLNCPVRHACKAYQASALQVVPMCSDSTPHTLTGWQLSRELAVLEDAQRKLEGRISGLKEQAAYMARASSEVFPFHELRQGVGRERYVDATAESTVLNLSKHFKVDAAKPVRPKSPAQLRKGGFPSNILKQYVERPSTGLKMYRVGPHDAAKKVSKFSEEYQDEHE